MLPTIPGVACTYQGTARTNILGTAPVTAWRVTPQSFQPGDLEVLAFAMGISTTTPSVNIYGIGGMHQIQNYANTGLTSYWQMYARVCGKGMTQGSSIGGDLSSACAGQLTSISWRPAAPNIPIAMHRRHNSTSIADGGPLTVATSLDIAAPSRVLGFGYGTSGGTSFSWTSAGGGGSRTTRTCALSATSQGRVNCVCDWNLSTAFSGGSITFSAGTQPTQLAGACFSICSPPLPGEWVDWFQYSTGSGATLSISGGSVTGVEVGDTVLLAAIFGSNANADEVTITGWCDDWAEVARQTVGGGTATLILFQGHLNAAPLTEQVIVTWVGGASRGGALCGIVVRGLHVGVAQASAPASSASNWTGPDFPAAPCDRAVKFGFCAMYGGSYPLTGGLPEDAKYHPTICSIGNHDEQSTYEVTVGIVTHMDQDAVVAGQPVAGSYMIQMISGSGQIALIDTLLEPE
jgi:hypothetical protein